MGVTPAPADPNAPGPFAFADEQRLRAILSSAGFGAVDVQRFNAALSLSATPRSPAEAAVQIGPVATSDGHDSLNGSTWIVSVTNPA